MTLSDDGRVTIFACLSPCSYGFSATHVGQLKGWNWELGKKEKESGKYITHMELLTPFKNPNHPFLSSPALYDCLHLGAPVMRRLLPVQATTQRLRNL